jgi:hypothetical protein
MSLRVSRDERPYLRVAYPSYEVSAQDTFAAQSLPGYHQHAFMIAVTGADDGF